MKHFNILEMFLSLIFSFAVVFNFFAFFNSIFAFLIFGNMLSYFWACLHGGIIVFIFYMWKKHWILIIKMAQNNSRMRAITEIKNMIEKSHKKSKK